eukprot:COSAG01_NODE_951_length_12498_cov_30.544018_14_plen_32_part_00
MGVMTLCIYIDLLIFLNLGVIWSNFFKATWE